MTPIVLESARRTIKPHRSAFRRSFSGAPLPWIMPAIIIIGIFYLYPMIDVFRLSLTNATLIGDSQHYTTDSIINTLGSPNLPDILWATFIFVGGSVVGQQLLGLAVSVIVVRGEKRGLFGMTLLRTTALVAWVVPGIAGGIIWQMLFSEAPYGALNSFLRLLHLPAVAWLSDPSIAPWSALLSNIWRGTAFSMVVMYATLKAIDPSLFEAAEVDGATPLQQFLFVTLPQLRVAILVNMILITIATFNTFDAIITLTGGGPGRATEIMALYIFNIVFRNYDLSGGSVLSVLMLLISLGLALIYASFLPREETR